MSPSTGKKVLFNLFVLLVLISQSAFGQTWEGTVSNDWNDPNNWNTAAVPTAAGNVIIPATVCGTCAWPMIPGGSTNVGTIDVQGEVHTNAGSGTLQLNTNQGINRIRTTGVLGSAGQPGNFTTLGSIIAQLNTDAGANVHMNVVAFRFGGQTRIYETGFHGTFEGTDFGDFGTWRGLRSRGCNFHGVFNFTANITTTGGSGNYTGFSGNTFHSNANITHLSTESNMDMGVTAGWFSALPAKHETFLGDLTIVSNVTGANRSFTLDGGTVRSTVAGNCSVTINNRSEARLNNLEVTGTTDFIIENTTNNNGIRLARDNAGHSAVFHGNVNIRATNCGTGDAFRVARLGNATFHSDVTFENTGATGNADIEFGEDYTQAGTVTLGAGAELRTTTYTSGRLLVTKVSQALGGTVPSHSLICSDAVQIWMIENTLQGNMVVTGNRMQMRQNVFGTDASNVLAFNHIGANGDHSGGNTFKSPVTFNKTSGNGWWSFGWNNGAGNGGADIMEHDVTVNVNSSWLAFAYSTSGNVYNDISGDFTVSLNGGRFFLGGWDTAIGAREFRIKGNASFDLDYNAGDGEGTLRVASHTSAVNISGQIDGNTIFDVNPTNGDNRAMIQVVQHNTHSMQFGGNIDITANSGGFLDGARIFFGSNGGSTTLAAGANVTANTNSTLYINNFTQTGTTGTHNIALFGGTPAPPENLEGGRLTFAGLTTFGGNLNIENTGVGGDWPPYQVLAAQNAGEVFTVNGNLTLVQNGPGGSRTCCDGNRFVFAPNGLMNLTGNLDITLAAGADIWFGEDNGWYGGTTPGSGYFVMNGTADQTITADSEVNFNNFRLDKPGGNVHFAGTATQHRTETNLDFAATNTAELYLNGINHLIYDAGNNPGTITGAGAATGYVVAEGTGRLFQRVTGANLNFPVGVAASYMPAILNNAGTADQFGVRMEDLSVAPYSISEYFLTQGWDIAEENAGGADLSITGEWPSAEHMPSFNTALSGFYWWNGSYFECLEPEGPAGGADPFTQDIASLGATNSIGILSVATAFADAYTGMPNVMAASSCGGFNLDANVDPFTGPGEWSQVSGPSTVTFADSGDPQTLASGLITGAYVFRWTTSFGCSNATSDVTVNFTLTSLTPVALCTWTGAANNGNWNDCTNWTGSVPGLVSPGVYSNVIIPGGLTTMYPVLSNDVIVGDYTMTAGAEIDLAGFIMESQGITAVAGSQVSGNGGVFLKTGTTSDTWSGANTFITDITIRNSGAGSVLSLAGTSGNIFENAVTFDIADATADILPSAAGTSSFRGNILAQSLRDADFVFDSEVLFDGTVHNIIEQNLQPNRIITYNNFTLNKTGGAASFTVTTFGVQHVLNTINFTEGQLLVADDALFSLRNSAPGSLTRVNGGVGSQDYAAALAATPVEGTGVFARVCAPGGSYLFPIYRNGWNGGFSMWRHYLPAVVTPNAGSDTDEIRVRQAYNHDAVGLTGTGFTLEYLGGFNRDEEHVTNSWAMTHETPGANLVFDLTTQWTTSCQWSFYERHNGSSATPGCTQANAEFARRFYRERSFMVRNGTGGASWECLQTHGAAVANGVNTWTRTATGIAPLGGGVLGLFSVASATADVSMTSTVQASDCRVMDLDATGSSPIDAADHAIMESPAGGEWVFISGPSTVVIVDPTNPVTQAVGASADGAYVFEWRRFSTECGGSLAAPIHSASVTINVTGTGAGIAGLTTTWTGAVNSDWNNCANWSDGVPDVITNVTIPAAMPNWPALPGDVTINSLVMNAGSEIDLINHTLTTTNDDGAAPTPVIDNAFRNQIQGAVIHSTTGTANFDMEVNGAAYIWARILQVRESEFTGDINLVINDDHNIIAECGGNTFREQARISNNSRSEWRWGRTAAGGGDIFQGDAYIEVTDNLSGVRPEYRDRFWNGWNTSYPPVYTGPVHPDPVDYITPPYYIPKSGVATYTGVKVGFASYPRIDYLPTNDPDPAVNAANFAANEAAEAANIADEDQSELNIVTARQNVYDAWALSNQAIDNLDNNINQITDVQGDAMASACGGDAAVIAANANLNTVLANASAFQTGALTTARDNAWTAYQDQNLATSTPGSDNAAANIANDAANTAAWHREQIWTELVNLLTAVNNCVDAYNASIGGVVGTTLASGYIRMADNSTGNFFLQNTYVKTKTAGRVHFCYDTGSEVRFGPPAVDNTLITEFFNSGSGGVDGAVFAGKRGVVTFNTPLRMIQQGGYADEDGSVRLYEQAPAQVFLNSDLEIQQTNAGSVWLGQNGVGTPGDIDLDGDLIIGNHEGDLHFHNFVKNSTTPFSVISGAQGRVIAYMTNVFNGDAVFENNGLGHRIGYDQAGQSHTFNGDVLFRNGSAEDVIRVSGRSDVFFNGNIQVENTFDFSTVNLENQCAVCFGGDHWDPGAVGETRLAAGQTITVGAGGFATGALELHQFIQEGIGTPQSIVMTSPESEIRTEENTTFHSTVVFNAPELSIRNSVFQPTAPDMTTFTHLICQSRGESSGGNTFHEPTTFEFRGVMSATNFAEWLVGLPNPDTFLDDVTVHSAGRGSRFYLAHTGGGTNNFARDLTLINGNAAGTDDIVVGATTYRNQIYLADRVGSAAVVNGDLTMESRASTTGRIQVARDGDVEIIGDLFLSNVNGNLTFGGSYTYMTDPGDVGTVLLNGDITLAPGWAQGTLMFKSFTSVSTTPVNIVLPATTNNILTFGSNSEFNASSLTGDAGRLFLNGSVFNGNSVFHKRADADDHSKGGNDFNGAVSITNHSGERVLLAEDNPDNFNANATFRELGTGRLSPAFSGLNSFKGNITVRSVNDRNFEFSRTLGSYISLGTAVFEGSGVQELYEDITGINRYVSFRKLEMAQASSTSSLEPQDDNFIIREEAVFRNGKVRLHDFDLWIQNHLSSSSVAVVGANLDDSYVHTNATGTVRRQVDAAGGASVTVLFPVGNAASYLAKGIKQNGGGAASDEYQVRVLDGVNTTYDAANNPTGAAINRMFVNGVWVTTESVAGGTDAELFLYWKPSDELPTFDRNLSSVVRYNKITDMWRCTQAPGAPDGATATPLFWRITGNAGTGVSDVGVFSVASIEADAVTPLTICGRDWVQMEATPFDDLGIVTPFVGEWSFISSTDGSTPVMPAAELNKWNAIFSGLNPGQTYVFRWQNMGLEGFCNPGPFIDVTVIVDPSSPIPGVLFRWTGNGNDNNWFNCLNWDRFSIPEITNDVLIPDVSFAYTLPAGTPAGSPAFNTTGTNTYPIITTLGADCKSLIIDPNASVEVAVGGVLTVEQSAENNQTLNVSGGNLEIGRSLTNTQDFLNIGTVRIGESLIHNNPTPLVHTAGIIEMYGAFTGTLGGMNTVTLNDLIMDKDALDRQITLTSMLTVTNQLTLNVGRMATDAVNRLELPVGASSNDGSLNSFVEGPMRKYVGDGLGFIFPSGRGTRWARISVTDLASVNAQDHFTAEYFTNNPYPNGPPNMCAAPAPVLDHVSYVEHWMLDRGNTGGGGGSSEAKVALYWEDPSVTASHIALFSNLFVGRYTGSCWENRGGTLFGSLASGFVQTPVRQSAFSPWTLATDLPIGVQPLPVDFLEFTATAVEPTDIRLDWSTAREYGASVFEIEKSSDGQNFRKIGEVEANGDTESVSYYDFLDINAGEGVLYYRLRQVDKTGEAQYSKVVSAELRSGSKEENIRLLPNPAVNGEKLGVSIFSKLSGDFVLTLTDALGREVTQTQIRLNEGANRLELPQRFTNLSAGIYFVKIVGTQLHAKLIIE